MYNNGSLFVNESIIYVLRLNLRNKNHNITHLIKGVSSYDSLKYISNDILDLMLSYGPPFFGKILMIYFWIIVFDVICELIILIGCSLQNNNMEKVSKGSSWSSLIKLYGTTDGTHVRHDVLAWSSLILLIKLNYYILEYVL